VDCYVFIDTLYLRGVHEISEMSWQLAIIILDEGDGFSFCE
jgi:hypothetical protein